MDKLEPTLANLEIVTPGAPVHELPDLRPALNQLLFRKLPFDVAGQLVLIAVAALLVFRSAGAGAFWLWLLAALAAQGWRYFQVVLSRREDPSQDPGVRQLSWSALAAGLCWGALALAALRSPHVPTQTMIMWTVAAALIWFASTQAARLLPFAAFAAAAVVPWLFKIPRGGAFGGLIQHEGTNMVGLALFLAFCALAAVVYIFQHQADWEQLRAESELAPLQEERISLASQVDRAHSALPLPVDSAPPLTAAASTAQQAVPAAVALRQALAESQTKPAQAERVLGSIDNMLLFNRLNQGAVQTQKQRVRVRDLLQALLTPLHGRAHERRLKLRAVMHANTPLEVITDAEKLRHILANLVGNAINFTHRGEVVVSVRRVDSTDSGCKLSIEVADTGSGIRADEQNKVFEPYYQANRRDSDEFGGLGLGLTVAQALARLLGGEITLQSQTGKGTVCTLLLPVDLPSAATPTISATHELTLGVQPPATQGANVTHEPAANDAFDTRVDSSHQRREPIYGHPPER